MACLGLERELQVRAPTGPAGSSTPDSAIWSLSCPPPPRLARTPGLPMGLPGRDSQLPRPALWLQSLSQGPRGRDIQDTSHSVCPHWTCPHGPYPRTGLPTNLGTPSPKLGSQLQFHPPSAPCEGGVLLVLSVPASGALHSRATCVSAPPPDTRLGAILHLSLGLWAWVGL